MASIAEVSVTVLPSEPVDTTSFYKNVLRQALSAGVHFMQVSKWLGHSTYTLTLDVYGDYIPEEDGGVVNNLPEPPARAKQADMPSNVISLFGRQAN